MRPPFALDAVSATADGRVRLELARCGRCVTMTPHQLLAKLAAGGPHSQLHFLVARWGTSSPKAAFREREITRGADAATFVREYLVERLTGLGVYAEPPPRATPPR